MKLHTLTILSASVLITQIACAGPIRDLAHKLKFSLHSQSQYDNSYSNQYAEVSSRRFFTHNQSYRQTNNNDRRFFSRQFSNRERTRSFGGNVPSSISTNGKETFVFNPRTLSWGAYNSNGSLVNSGRASGGRGYCPDVKRPCRTPSGTFAVHRKGGPGCVSSKFPIGRGGAPMPNCMFFHGGYAIHGSPDVPNYNASHGCIRVQPHDAAWLNQNFMRHGTRVIVKPY